MRSDLEKLLVERGLDGFVVLGHSTHSAPLYYFARGAQLGESWFLVGRGGKAHLIHNPMERDSAAQAGVPMSTPAENNFSKLLDSSGSLLKANARMVGERLRAMGVTGKVAIYGSYGAQLILEVRRTLVEEFGLEVAPDESELQLPDAIRYTKDPDEIETTRKLGVITCGVMGQVRDYLKGLKREGAALRRKDGGVPRIGDLRTIVRLGFAAHGLTETHGNIIAQGRDAGVPHNHGNDAEEIRPGECIVVDIYPQQQGGGYHFDMTRTFCVGAPSAELKKIYDTVREAHETVLKMFKVGSLARDYQDWLCDFYEQRGHDTLRKNDRCEEGYVHSLGHGLGLDLHERPHFRLAPQNRDALLPGTVFTVEPGLYYPSRGIGVRLEDVLVTRQDGTFENLTDFPLEMEL